MSNSPFRRVRSDDDVRELILSDMKSLFLEGPKVTDQSLGLIVANCSRLGELSLSETKVTSRGLQSIRQLKTLNWLFVDSFEVTDQWLRDLAMLPQLKGLHLVDTNVTESGFALLDSLENLAYLEVVSINKIGIDGLRAITNKANLEYLRLSATTIDEERFSQLELPKSLRSFSFEMPFVSEQAFEDLKKKFPHCQINRYRFQRSEHQAGYEEAMLRAIQRSPVPTGDPFCIPVPRKKKSTSSASLSSTGDEVRREMDHFRKYDDRAQASGLLTVQEVEMLIERGLLEPEFRKILYRRSI